MAIANGISKRVAYKKESVWGDLPGATGAKVLRRVTASFNLEKESYESNEIRQDFQTADFRHGVARSNGSISGELSPGTYADFFAAAVARDFTAGVTSASLSYTIAASGDFWTATRDAGNFLTEGFKVGDVVRITAAGGNAANVGKNLLIIGLTATIATVAVLNGSALVAEGPIASATVAVQGKKTFCPLTGHTDDSFTFEEFYSDIAQSEVTSGNKVGSIGISLPATGLATFDLSCTGKSKTTNTSAYFTSPTAASTTGLLTAVQGLLVVNGAPVAVLTGLNININRNLTDATVVGSNSVADIFTGRCIVDGDFTAYFTDGTIRDYFLNESEISIVATLATSSAKDSDFISITLPKVKINSDGKDDGETGITSSHSFRALLNSAGGTGVASEASTIVIQDSDA